MAHERWMSGPMARRQPGTSAPGWTERHVYRARAIDSSFASFDGRCDTCGETHRNPYEGDPHYITPRVPVRVAKNWASHHGIVVHVEKRMAYVHKKGRRPDRVQLVPYTDWMTIRTITP